MGRPTKQGEPGVNREDRILAASLKLFALRGERGASIRAIAREAGLTEGTLYHYFASKDEILDRVLETHAFTGERVAEVLASASGDLRAKLTRLATELVVALEKNPALTALLISEGARYPVARKRQRRNHFYDLMQRRAARLAAFLDVEIAAGRAARCNTLATARHFFNTLTGFWITELFIGGRLPSRADRDAHIEDTVDLLMARLEP